MNVPIKPRKKPNMQVRAEMQQRSRNMTVKLEEAKSVLINFGKFYADYFPISCLKSVTTKILQHLRKYTENLWLFTKKKEDIGFIICTMLFKS